MAEHQTFTTENQVRIRAVARSFGHAGKMLLKSERILVGEGCLLKLCRRGPKPKVFFLFNDILVYGSIVVPGRWNNRQKIIPLEEVELEDLEDGLAMPNQWLIRMPRKSFYVSAASPEEKIAWMGHIKRCRALHMQKRGLPTDIDPGKFAATWIPDMASAICMRCSKRFNVANRRHHCRRCGYIVCQACSKSRDLLPNISSKPVRVCRNCVSISGQEQRQKRKRVKHWKNNSVEDSPSQPEIETSSDEELDDMSKYQVATKWFNNQVEGEDCSPYCYIKPEHINPPVTEL